MNAQKVIRTTEDIELKITGITLLSVEEYEETRANIPPVHDYWWLRSPGYNGSSAADVRGDGDVDLNGNDVDYEDGVRPALRISNLESSNPKIGDEIIVAERPWTVINEGLAIANKPIGACAFRKDWRAEDANNYEASDVKKYIEKWAAKNGIEFENE